MWAEGDRVHVANTGAPLTVDGVRALTALRVSPKASTSPSACAADDAVGRFGVGFRATSFAGRVDLLSESGSITFDRARAAAAAGADDVPAQRLAWPLAARPTAGFHTEAVLWCGSPESSDDGAETASRLVAEALAEAPDLLLELPALHRIGGVGQTLTRIDRPDRVVIADADGRPAATWLQAARGVHRWLVPTDGARIRPLEADVLRSPTPTQIPLSLPARLISRLPLTPDRRELHPDADPAAAATAYPALMLLAPDDERHLLVPAPAFAAGPEDAVLRAAILAELAAAPWVPAADGNLLTPARGRVLRGLNDALAALLGEVIAPLVAPVMSDGAPARTLLRLGAQELGLAELADLLGGIEREPSWWARLYAELDALALGRDLLGELGAVPVPRSDGRLHRGARGLFVVDGAVEPDSAPDGTIRTDWIPVIDPAAYHPLLDRLGLEHLAIEQVLNHPALEAELAQALDDGDCEELADSVLRLLAVAPDASALPSGLGALEIPAVDPVTGESDGVRPVDELLLPSGPLRGVLYDDAPFGVVDPAVVEAYGAEPLRRLGAGWGFTLVHDDLPTAPEHDLDRERQWWDSLEVPPERLVAVRDLDLVDPARWPEALTLLVGDPETAAALADPLGYTRWWLRRFAALDDTALRHRRDPDSADWRGLFDPLDHPAAPELAAAGLLADTHPDDAADAEHWLTALADPDREIAPGVAVRAHAALTEAYRTGRFTLDEVAPPDRLRTLDGGVAAEGVVVEHPWWLEVLPAETIVAAALPPEPRSAAELAALLDVPSASERYSVRVVLEGRTVDPDSAEAVAFTGRTGWAPSGPLILHDELVVARFDGTGERRFPVTRWQDGSGALHASVRWIQTPRRKAATDDG
ncbi:MAG: hypothetical protein QM809_00955 [Gordonia sp. (in: high G+C Gram-positive bacteria)]